MSPRRPPPRRSSRSPQKRAGQAERGLGGEQVEGRQAVRELLAARRRRVREVLLSERVEETDAIAEIVDLASEARVPVRRVPRERLDASAATESPQGVVARADPLSEADLDDLVAPGDTAPFLVILDGVTDPQNLGAIVRTAHCAGATGIVLPRHRGVHVTAAAAKAAAGAIEHVPMTIVAGIPAAMLELGRSGVWTVGLDADADQSLFDLEVADQPVALVLGAEGRGLARLTAERCDVLVAVPLFGNIASLNVHAAAAIACFEVARARFR